VAALKRQADNQTWTDDHTQQYKKRDTMITDAMIYVENHMGKKYCTKYEWSPTLLKMVNTHQYWYLRLKQSRGQKISLPRLHFYCE
jgi:hypothetical protein